MNKLPKIRETLVRLESPVSALSDDELKKLLTVQSDDRLQFLAWIGNLIGFQVSSVTEEVLYEEVGQFFSDISHLRINEICRFIKATGSVEFQLENWYNILGNVAIFRRSKQYRTTEEIDEKIQEILQRPLFRDLNSTTYLNSNMSLNYSVPAMKFNETFKPVQNEPCISQKEIIKPSIDSLSLLAALQKKKLAIDEWISNNEQLLPKETSSSVDDDGFEKRLKELKSVVGALTQLAENIEPLNNTAVSLSELANIKKPQHDSVILSLLMDLKKE